MKLKYLKASKHWFRKQKYLFIWVFLYRN